MRTIFIVDHEWPPSEDDLAASAAAGASEILCGIPPALAALGITTFGYHEVAPPPGPRRLIAKSTVQERVNSLGKWDDVIALMFTADRPNIYFGRWFAANWGEVFADDPDMLMLLELAGCTPEEIADITAP